MKIANAEMAAAWDGHEGELWAEHAERYEDTGRRIWSAFLDRRPIGPTDDVLDVGCGTGRSTRDAARLTSGSVLGVDLSSRMLERAGGKAEAEDLHNVRFEQADAQVHEFDPGAFDVAISSFGVMFFGDPVAAFANIGRALRPGGRLAVLTWADLAANEWVEEILGALALGRPLSTPPPDAPGPFSLADPDRVRRLLGAAGFADVDLEALHEPVRFGDDTDHAFGFVRTLGIVEGMTKDLDPAGRAEALDALRRTVAAHDTGEGVWFAASAWLVTASRP